MAFVASWKRDPAGLESTANTALVTVGINAGVGHLLVGAVVLRAGAGIALPDTPTGWALVSNLNIAGNARTTVYHRIATGDANDNLSVTWAGNARFWDAFVIEDDAVESLSQLTATNGTAFTTSAIQDQSITCGPADILSPSGGIAITILAANQGKQDS